MDFLFASVCNAYAKQLTETRDKKEQEVWLFKRFIQGVVRQVSQGTEVYNKPKVYTSTMVHFSISGLVAPVFTPINEDFSINYSLIPQYLKFLVDEGIHAVLVAGTSGEVTCLNVAERKKLAETWVLAGVARNVKVIVQVGGAPFPDVLQLANHAERIKADAILTLPELYFKPKTAEELVVYLQDVAEAAPSVPLLYYHHPKMSHVNVDLKKLFALASDRIPNFKGMKADLNDALQVAEFLTDDKKIFIANHLLAPAALLGQTNSIATITNLFPAMVMDMLAAVKENDVKTARALQEKLIKMIDAISSNGDWVPTMKWAMELVSGLKVGPPRRPMTSLTEEQKKNVSVNLKNICNYITRN